MPLTYAFQVAGDGDKSGEFARRTRVGLQAGSGEAGNHGQQLPQLIYHLQVALGLLYGGEGVDTLQGGEANGSISDAAFSFMVQEPRDIME